MFFMFFQIDEPLLIFTCEEPCLSKMLFFIPKRVTDLLPFHQLFVKMFPNVFLFTTIYYPRRLLPQFN